MILESPDVKLNGFTLGIFPPKIMTSSVQEDFHKPEIVLICLIILISSSLYEVVDIKRSLVGIPLLE